MRSMIQWLALTFFVSGVPIAACAQPSTPVGERHGTTHTPSAAVRDAAHRDVMRYTVWYPAAAGSKEAPIIVGPPDAPLFNVGSAAADAAIARGRFPTLLLSHGNGGTARIMGWFGIAMARAGYVVIAVDHPGNNGMDEMTVAGSTLIWERAEDLKAALNAVLADRTLAPHVDTARLGLAGFSAGGFAALAGAGARVDVDHFIAFCRAHPDDSTCRPQKESPDITFEAHLKAAATPELAPFMRQSEGRPCLAWCTCGIRDGAWSRAGVRSGRIEERAATGIDPAGQGRRRGRPGNQRRAGGQAATARIDP